MKKKIIKGIIAISIIGGIFAIIIGCVLGIAHLGKNRVDPIRFCISEISQHENYSAEFTFVYEELEPIKEVRNSARDGCDLYAYYITTFAPDRKGEWYCYVELKSTFLSSTIFNSYAPEDLVVVNCDLIAETLYS